MSNPRWLHILSRTLRENSPAILSGIAVTGVVGTVVLAVRATPKACEAIAQAKDDKAYELQGEGQQADPETIELTKTELVHATWRLYLPSAITGVATIACVIGSNRIDARRQASLAGAYTMLDQLFREYKSHVTAEIGEQKERKIHDKVMQDRMDRNPPRDGQVLITGLGEQLCYDSLTGRYFKSDIEAIRRAANTVNQQVLRDMYASHNEFYALLGLGSTTIGEELGWNIDNLIDLVFTSHLSECDMPCLAIGYAKLPVRNYDRF
jgi:Family of unknown function (DUF6353)